MTDPKTFIEANKERLLDELFSLLRIPSISADPAYNSDVAKCAEHIAEHMNSLGIDSVEIFPTAGHPIVYGECLVEPDYPLFWFMVIMMCSLRIQLTYGIMIRSNPLLKPQKSTLKGLFLHAARVMTKVKCSCTLRLSKS